MPVTTTWTRVGAEAFDALATEIAGVKRDDVLAPVTVVTPTASAGLSLRRALARRAPTVAVSFDSIETLAQRIAAPRLGHVEITPDRNEVVTAVRVALASSSTPFATIARHRSTWEVLARSVLDLARLDAASRSVVARNGGLAAALVDLHDVVASQVVLDPASSIVATARARLADTPAASTEIGTVIVHLPDDAPRHAVALIGALSEQTDVRVIAGLTGIESVDRATAATVGALGATSPDDAVGSGALAAEIGPDQVLSANDIDDEIGAAVRLVLARASGPEGIPLHRMALVHPSGSPYASAVADVLHAADVPYSGPSVDTLAHSAAGRVLLALFDIVECDFSRDVVLALWASGAVVGPDGAVVSSVRLDERSRRLGIVGGRASWHERIEARVERIDAERASSLSPTDRIEEDPLDDAAVERRARERSELADLAHAFASVEDWIDAIPDRWEDLGDWADRVLDDACGPLTRRKDWPTWELDADLAVRAALGSLRSLATLEPEPGTSLVMDTVRAVLAEPAPRRAKVGAGLTVTTIDDPPLRPHDIVVVLGMAEGHIPHVHREDVVLGDSARAEVGLPTSGDGTIRQRRGVATALASATDTAVMTYARCDQRSGRTQVPSRWLIDGLEVSTGSRPRTETLMAGHTSPTVEVIASHESAVRSTLENGRAALHHEEFVRAHLSGADDLDAHPAVGTGLVHTAATMIRSRQTDAFTRFDGNLQGDGYDAMADGRHLSPTSLELYAECPRRWFFRHALGVGATDRPEEVDQLQPRDKGTLAHRILERFVGDAITADAVPEPVQAWSTTDLDRLVAIAEDVFAEFERKGLVGHPTWWEDEKREIMATLYETVTDDDRMRMAESSTPVAVELTFGRDGHDPLDVELDDGRLVRLAGQADRVDVVPGGVMVHDYKYSGKDRYTSLNKRIEEGGDPLAGGTRMQLVAYAEAAARQYAAQEASAWYWFLKPGHRGARIGYSITDAHRAMFRQTLATLLDGIGNGHYPARSGPMSWFWGTNDHCGFCDFRAVCPDDREDEWERVKHHPDLRPLRTLVEDGAPALADAHRDDLVADPGTGTTTGPEPRSPR